MEWFDSAWQFLGKLLHPKSIIEYGGLYLLLFVVFAETGLLVGFFLPGDSLLFTAGLFVGIGVVKQPILLVSAMLAVASAVGDSTGYFIGRRGGPKVFNRKESLLFKPEYVTMTREFYEKYGAAALILGKFLPVIRTFAPVMAGVAQLSYYRFVSFSLVGSVLWTVSLSLVGYFLGRTYPWIQDYLEWIIIGLIVFTTIPIARKIYVESRKAQKAQATEKQKEETTKQT
jgi:membrane-associated protein